MNQDRSHRQKYWYLLFFVAALLLAASVYFHRSYDEEVTVSSPTIQSVESTASTNGIVVPIDDFKARASFPGIVDDVPARLGQEIRAGQVLVRMRDPFAASRVVSASVALKSAELTQENIAHNGSQEDRIGSKESQMHAQLEQAAALRDLDLIKQLQHDGSASLAEVDAATRRLDNASAALIALKERATDRYSATDRATWAARVNEAKSALIAERANEANAIIVSPISGTVYLEPVSKYDFVQTGSNLVDVADLSRVEIHASFDEPDIGKLRRGQPVRILWDGRPNQTWHGHLNRPPLAVTVSGTRSVGDSIITVDDAKSDLPADTHVTVIVTIQKRFNVLTIPREALHSVDGQSFVFRIVGQRLVHTPVDIGIVDLARVQITGGLTAKDVIALHTNDDREMSNAMTVKVIR